MGRFFSFWCHAVSCWFVSLVVSTIKRLPEQYRSSCSRPPMEFKWGIARDELGWREAGKKVVDLKAAAAEMVAMTLFVIIGCGVACGHGASDGETRLVVAFAFGMGILVLAYTIGHHSGGRAFSLTPHRSLSPSSLVHPKESSEASERG